RRPCRHRPLPGSPERRLMQRVAVLGATGSIGGSALDVIARHPGSMRASVLAAGGNVAALVALCTTHRPAHAVVGYQAALPALREGLRAAGCDTLDRKSTRLNSSHVKISYAVFCLKKKK